MTKYKIAMRIQQGLIHVVILAAVAVSAYAQGICVQSPLVVNSLNGKVVSKLTKGEAPIVRASIVLLEDRYQGRVLAQTTSDANGVFKFNKRIKLGKYILKVSYPELATFYGPVSLVKSGSALPSEELVIIIGADFTKPCGGSSAEVRTKKDGDPSPR
jgi:hypothetical protein